MASKKSSTTVPLSFATSRPRSKSFLLHCVLSGGCFLQTSSPLVALGVWGRSPQIQKLNLEALRLRLKIAKLSRSGNEGPFANHRR